jgi:hypothetical protein
MNSGSGSANSANEDSSESSSGVRSRSCTIWNAGRVARIAGVMRFGLEGRFFDIDCRISRDCCSGGDVGGDGDAIGVVLNCKLVSRSFYLSI